MSSAAPGRSFSATTPAPTAPPVVRHVHGGEIRATLGPPELTRQAIAQAAYFLWLERGGSETENWLAAEAKLRAEAARGRSR